MADAHHETCPFCGQQRLLLKELRKQVSSYVEFFVYCGTCGAEGPWARTQDEALSKWNMRHEPRKTALVAIDLDESS